MSRITTALKKAAEERNERLESETMNTNNNNGKVGNSWLVWVFVIGVVITIFVAFNYDRGANTIPLSEIFPEENTGSIEVTDASVQTQQPQAIAQGSSQQQAQAPIQQSAPVTQTVKQTVEPVKTAVPQTTVASSQKKDAVETSAGGYAYTIQVASFKTNERAQTEVEALKKKGYDGFVMSKDLGDKGTWHRVYVGKYASKPQAQQALENVIKDFKNSFIISSKF